MDGKMSVRELGEKNDKKLAFGLMRLPLLDENDTTTIDLERVKKMVDSFLDAGFFHFDTAAPYHGKKSEDTFCQAVAKRYPRDIYTITDKVTLGMVDGKEYLQEFFDMQLKRLGVDYIDIYLLHGISDVLYEKAKRYEAFEFLVQKKKEGKIRHIGFSFHDSADVLDLILKEHPEVEYVQLQINYLDWDDENVQSEKCYDVAVKHGKKVLVMEPVRGGILANLPAEAERMLKEYNPKASVASWAIRFCASLENVEMVLSGMSNETQIDDNINVMSNFKPLTDAEREIIKDVVKILRKDVVIPCTECSYCEDKCPKNIAIPAYLKLYNALEKTHGASEKWERSRYVKKSKVRGKASECIGCGLCEANCPQHLPIRELLKEVVTKLE